MKAILKQYLPSMAIVFMVGTIISSIWNIIAGNDKGGYFMFILQFAGFIILIEFVEYTISHIPFKKYSHYFLACNAVYYILYLLAAYLLNWFPFETIFLIFGTISFFLTSGFIHLYFRLLGKREADEINELLSRRE